MCLLATISLRYTLPLIEIFSQTFRMMCFALPRQPLSQSKFFPAHFPSQTCHLHAINSAPCSVQHEEVSRTAACLMLIEPNDDFFDSTFPFARAIFASERYYLHHHHHHHERLQRDLFLSWGRCPENILATTHDLWLAARTPAKYRQEMFSGRHSRQPELLGYALSWLNRWMYLVDFG